MTQVGQGEGHWGQGHPQVTQVGRGVTLNPLSLWCFSALVRGEVGGSGWERVGGTGRIPWGGKGAGNILWDGKRTWEYLMEQGKDLGASQGMGKDLGGSCGTGEGFGRILWDGKDLGISCGTGKGSGSVPWNR